jgi:hypothetical protein
MRFGHLDQLRTGQQIEEIDRLDAANASPHVLSMLLGLKLGITISQGWPRGWSGACLVTNILPIPANLPLTFQPLGPARPCRGGLSKCHSP